MTENDTLLRRITGESSRRSFMKKSAIASAGLAMGLSGTGTLAAQDDTDQNAMNGLMFNPQFHPRGQFRVISDAIDWAPVETDEDDFLGDENDELLFNDPDVFARFNTRIIEYQGSIDDWSMLFVHESATVREGQVYELSPAFEPFGRDDFEEFGIEDDDIDDDLFLDDGGNELGLVSVHFSPAQGDEGGQGTTTQGAGNQTDTGN